MASEKKIMMFDESTGMLTLEVMTAYINNELSPSLRADVENFLAKDEMHRDIIEGLKQVRDKHQAEKTIHSINEKISGLTGAAVSTGVSFEMPVFFTDYKKIAAAAGGILVVAGIIFTLTMLKETPAGMASREDKTSQSKEETPPEKTVTVEKKITEPVAVSAEDDETGTFADSAADGQEGEAASLETAAEAGAVPDEVDSKNNTELAANERKPQATLKKTKTEDISVPDAGTGTVNLAAPASVAVEGASIAESRAATDSVIALQDSQSSMAAVPMQQAPAANMQMPEFPGGEAGLRKYIRDNLIYPKEAKGNGVQGKVELEFYVGTTGRVKNIRITKGVSKEINAEAVRLITNMPKWKPGKLDGKSSTLQQHLTIDFVIE